MPKRLIPLAIAYDFDGTLAPGNMQEHDFIPKIGMTKKAFWKEVGTLSRAHEADNILVYMKLMLERAQAAHVPVRKSDFESFGATLKLFAGVVGWFDRINAYGRATGVRVEHYVISSGIREMVSGTPVAKKFKAVFASSFMYDHHGVAQWPALVLNYTTKTQYLFRINKGSLYVHDHTKINEYVPKVDRPIPFEQMIFIGDGETDIPCFRLVKDQGGHAVAVYRPRSTKAKQQSKLLTKAGRVNFVAPADYRKGRDLDRVVKSIIDKLASDHRLRLLGRLA